MDNNFNIDEMESFVIPALALRGISLFPSTILNFEVVRPKSVAAINYALKYQKDIFLLLFPDTYVSYRERQ